MCVYIYIYNIYIYIYMHTYTSVCKEACKNAPVRKLVCMSRVNVEVICARNMLFCTSLSLSISASPSSCPSLSCLS